MHKMAAPQIKSLIYAIFKGAFKDLERHNIAPESQLAAHLLAYLLVEL